MQKMVDKDLAWMLDTVRSCVPADNEHVVNSSSRVHIQRVLVPFTAL